MKTQILKNFMTVSDLEYSIYNLTNKATINKWGFYESIIDTLWGGILFSLITFIITKYTLQNEKIYGII
jgi:uncharacterized membrane protein